MISKTLLGAFGILAAITANTWLCSLSHAEQPVVKPLDLLSIFEQTHDGWSLDEVIIRDDLRGKVVEAARAAGSNVPEAELFEELIALRKSGKLTIKSTKSHRVSLELETPAAEIAARRILEQSGESLDRVFVDPTLLAQFDRYAAEVIPTIDPYLARRAALRLRKTRQLRPELLARVTDWKVEVSSAPVQEVSKDLSKLPKRPGVYIFRDATGYLYIGQSKDLRDRLTKHLKESDRLALADYLSKGQGTQQASEVVLELHVFQAGSPAEETVIREAYESELIRTRKPRLNLAP